MNLRISKRQTEIVEQLRLSLLANAMKEAGHTDDRRKRDRSYLRTDQHYRLTQQGWELDMHSTILSRKHSYHKLIGRKRYVKVRKETK